MRGGVGPLGRTREDVVEHLQHVLVVADLAFACWVAAVARPLRDLVPHGGEIHVDARVGFDEGAEFLEHGDEGLGRVGVDMCDLLT